MIGNKKFAIGFNITMAIGLFLNVLPYIYARIRVVHDGFQTLGFPFTFWLEGGFSYRQEFTFLALLANFALIVSAAFGIGHCCRRIKSAAVGSGA